MKLVRLRLTLISLNGFKKNKKNMIVKNILLSCLFFFIGHVLIWFQLNGQFIWKSWRDNMLIVSLLGIPVSIFFLLATKWGVSAFGGLFWPPRFIGFSVGIIIYGLMVSYYFNEDFTLKTMITLILALIIVTIQVFWK